MIRAVVSTSTDKNLKLEKLLSKIKEAHRQQIASYRNNIKYAAKCGELLLQARKLVKKNWLQWVETNTKLSGRTADRWMQVAENWSKIKEYLRTNSDCDLSIVEVLAAAGVSHRNPKKAANYKGKGRRQKAAASSNGKAIPAAGEGDLKVAPAPVPAGLGLPAAYADFDENGWVVDFGGAAQVLLDTAAELTAKPSKEANCKTVLQFCSLVSTQITRLQKLCK